MKKKLAALLRRWAYALHPETPATLPPGYQVAKLVSRENFPLEDGTMPTPEIHSLIRGGLEADVLEQVMPRQLYKKPRRHCLRTGRLSRIRSKPLRRLHTQEKEITITHNKTKGLC